MFSWKWMVQFDLTSFTDLYFCVYLCDDQVIALSVVTIQLYWNSGLKIIIVSGGDCFLLSHCLKCRPRLHDFKFTEDSLFYKNEFSSSVCCLAFDRSYLPVVVATVIETSMLVLWHWKKLVTSKIYCNGDLIFSK